ncbi:RNA:NAD 2'-phosphotransferase [Geminocystis sp. NIES-3708]|uniref:RNA 2'-phosphotransferase n=1 Tax=Geminocystis sp. NIES-3708 TaxID=1615909 RepID=UPI0005FC9359|nr:RNA 2'-phosphotransferase [Geminocystis sp. NIES-3708]BAQ61284.1 RNA:NAD 2'-phosphotransferase [Geminocystis sp. NIES-3708]
MDKNENKLVTISKFLSKYLRHKPLEIGLNIDSQGWVDVEELLFICKVNNFSITKSELKEVVISSDKNRFSFDKTGTKIRANQGHSIKIDLDLKPEIPPSILYHGTGKQFIDSIFQEGLLKMSRHHVHLSSDIETAKKVGQRKGKLVILKINALSMHKNGYLFYISDNGVWLVDFVPANYLMVF